MGFLVSLLALAWAVWHSEYYTLSPGERPTHAEHRDELEAAIRAELERAPE